MSDMPLLDGEENVDGAGSQEFGCESWLVQMLADCLLCAAFISSLRQTLN